MASASGNNWMNSLLFLLPQIEMTEHGCTSPSKCARCRCNHPDIFVASLLFAGNSFLSWGKKANAEEKKNHSLCVGEKQILWASITHRCQNTQNESAADPMIKGISLLHEEWAVRCETSDSKRTSARLWRYKWWSGDDLNPVATLDVTFCHRSVGLGCQSATLSILGQSYWLPGSGRVLTFWFITGFFGLEQFFFCESVTWLCEMKNFGADIGTGVKTSQRKKSRGASGGWDVRGNAHLLRWDAQAESVTLRSQSDPANKKSPLSLIFCSGGSCSMCFFGKKPGKSCVNHLATERQVSKVRRRMTRKHELRSFPDKSNRNVSGKILTILMIMKYLRFAVCARGRVYNWQCWGAFKHKQCSLYTSSDLFSLFMFNTSISETLPSLALLCREPWQAAEAFGGTGEKIAWCTFVEAQRVQIQQVFCWLGSSGETGCELWVIW